MLVILRRFMAWSRFWLLWIISSGLNFIILATVRQFYYTDDFYSEYFEQVSGPIDNWVAVVGGFACLLLIYLLNEFYKDKALIVTRFSFVSAIQFLLLGILRLASAPFALKYNKAFELTASYVMFSVGAILLSLILFGLVARTSGESFLIMIKRLLRIYREDKFR
ncbi:MAG: hypothetical protein GX228_08855 [Firmicutes bacterium]|nr:hypothetical protein [Bacillota bacterium]NLL89016.1 hypothetical protein [Bacillota bacterium]